MNKYIGIGCLGSDPEIINNGCKFGLAVQYYNGTEKTILWVKVLVFGKIADNCISVLTKGKRILIEGRLDKLKSNGELVVVAQTIEFL